MAETRSRKVSILIFLFAVFILLAVFTGSWLYRMYKEQTDFSERKTLATVECGRYYFTIDPKSVLYENGTMYFEIENTLGADIGTIIVKSASEEKEVALGGLGQGTVMPVQIPIAVTEWVQVYPKGCEGVNFRNISFEPRI
jgi:hypothetical protein